MTDPDKKAIAQSFIRGLGSRDGTLLRSIMTEDVVWSLPGESPMSGEAHGVEACPSPKLRTRRFLSM